MKIILIIAQDQYRDEEYEVPKNIFTQAGHEVVTASKKVGPCRGKLGGTTQATIAIEDIDVSNYSAVIFVGGAGAIDYQHDVQAHLTAQEAVNREKVLGAICIAPTILAYAGILDGIKATVWNGESEPSKILEQQGAHYVNETVVVDGKIVTANGPEAAEEFAKKVLELI